MDNKSSVKYDKDKIISTVKDVIKDRGISAEKDELISNTITYGLTGAGVSYGVKKQLGSRRWKNLSSAKKGQILKKSVLTKGVPILAITGVAMDSLVPAFRMRSLHKKEFGTTPNSKDYGKLVAVKGAPSAIYYGMLFKNRKTLTDSLTKAVKSAPKVITAHDWSARKKAIKIVVGGAAAGGSLGLMDEALGVVQYVHTPETIVKAKKNKVKGVHDMKMKNAFEIIDSAFEKIASVIEESNTEPDKTAEDLVNLGFEKIAAKESLLGSIGNVLSGKNVQKARTAMNTVDTGSKVISNAGKVVDVADKQLGNLQNAKVKALRDFAKEKRVRIDKNGNKVNTQFAGKDEAELSKAFNNSRSQIGTLSKERNTNQKTINDIRNQMVSAKKKTRSERDGVFGKVENVVHGGQYKKNREYNSKIDNLTNQMKQNRAISNKDLSKTKKTIFGGKKTIENQDFLEEIKKFNVASAGVNKSQKRMNRTKATVGDIQHELNSLKNSSAIGQKTQAVQDAKKFKGIASSTKGLKDSFRGLQEASGVSVADEVSSRAHSKYNRELAKTVGAYGAIGGGAYLGSKALQSKKSEQTSTQAPAQSSTQTFRPRYDFNAPRQYQQ